MTHKTGAWIILFDRITEPNDECCRTGKHSHDWTEDCIKSATLFQAYDDDGILYYEGLLLDDDWCSGQERVLEYTMNDAGCTHVKVFRNGKWVQEIG